MLLQYIQAAMRHAKYEILEDDGAYYGEIPECQGVWASANTLEGCRAELEEVLGDWILLRVRAGLPLPRIDGIDMNVKEAA